MDIRVLFGLYLLLSLCLFGGNELDREEGRNGKNDTERQADPDVLNES